MSLPSTNLFAAAAQAQPVLKRKCVFLIRQSKALVEFRAGSMTREGSLVKPDTRKGLVQLVMVCRVSFYNLST